MKFHDVHLFCGSLKLDSFAALVAAVAGFLFFKWSLWDVLFGVVLEQFELYGRVHGAMQHACIFRTGRRISQMDCIVSLALVSAALLLGWMARRLLLPFSSLQN